MALMRNENNDREQKAQAGVVRRPKSKKNKRIRGKYDQKTKRDGLLPTSEFLLHTNQNASVKAAGIKR